MTLCALKWLSSQEVSYRCEQRRSASGWWYFFITMQIRERESCGAELFPVSKYLVSTQYLVSKYSVSTKVDR